MAVEPEEELLLEDEPEQEAEAPPETGEDEEQEQPTEEADEADEETVITFGDEAAPASGEQGDTNLVKHLRDEIRKRNERIAELERTAPRSQPVEVGPKPTLADCDYDEDAFAEAFEAWQQRKAQAAAQQNETSQAQQSEQEAWQAELRRYDEDKKALGLPGVDEAEATVTAALDTVQQAVLVKAANDPAKIMYALARHPEQLSSLAQIRDPLKLAAAVARLEGKMQIVKRRKAPEPEQVQRGGAGLPKGTDKQLERLEKEAERTGDRTKVIAYRKKLKAQGK